MEDGQEGKLGNEFEVDLDEMKQGGKGEEKSVKRRQQNNEAARRFRAKRKEEIDRLRKEVDELREREKKHVMLLEQTKRYMYSQNVSLIKFPTLREIEQAIVKYQQNTPEAMELSTLDGLIQGASSQNEAGAGAGMASLGATSQQLDLLQKQMMGMEERILERIDTMFNDSGHDRDGSGRRRFNDRIAL